MPQSTSRISYEDCYKLFDRALKDPKGVRVRRHTREAAYNLRSRLHYARKLDRLENLLTYPEGEELHGRSRYDSIVVTMPKTDKFWYVSLQQVDTLDYEVESLSETLEPAVETVDPRPAPREAPPPRERRRA